VQTLVACGWLLAFVAQRLLLTTAITRGGKEMLHRLNENLEAFAIFDEAGSTGAFTLVEIMIVVAIIALLATIALPGFLRARKRSEASDILNDLRLIDAAVDQYAIENNKASGTAVAVADWTAYVKAGTSLYTTASDQLGDAYGGQTVDTIPKVPANTFKALSDVAPSTFWAPYY
jgi:prepilin-type N-terminal cleavage/methylation domain-containing protein